LLFLACGREGFGITWRIVLNMKEMLKRAYRSDYIKLYFIIAGMLLLGFVVLGRLIASIKTNQAVKLGED
jgi:hypothetical protein